MSGHDRVAHAPRRWRTRIGDAALGVAAVLGVVCILLVIAAAVFDVRVVLFRTGSMSPTIPTGSAAVVRTIPASEIAVGDVVTVERPGRLPITHRVETVSSDGVTGDGRIITMRGDANAAADPFPYAVERVRLVVFSVPGIAPVVAAMGTPWVIGGVTVAATALVVGVFWPRRRTDSPSAGEDAAADDGDPPAAATAGLTRTAAVGLIGVLVAGAPLVSPDRADAATERVVEGSVIRLVSIESAEMSGLIPGTTASWVVGVSADAPTPGTVTIRLSSQGDAALGLRYSVDVCDRRWSGAACAGARTRVDDLPVPLDGVERTIERMADTEERWLRISVTMPAAAGDERGLVDLVVRAVGVGDDVAVGDQGLLPDGGIAETGGRSPWPLALGGAVMLTVGGVMLVRSRHPSGATTAKGARP